MKHLSRRTRTRLLHIAALLESWAAGIRKYCSDRTPRRGKRQPKDHGQQRLIA